MEYYHIQKLDRIDKEWFENQIFDTEVNEPNPFFKDILKGLNDNYLRKMGNAEDLLNYTEQKLDEDNCHQKFADFETYDEQKHSRFLSHCSLFEDLTERLTKVHRQYLKWVREEIFEKIRLEINPNLPSRKKSIWMCYKNDLSKWWEILNTYKKKIFKIEIYSEKIFIADEHYCELQNFSIEEFESNARKYWTGEITENPVMEILYEGKFKVVKGYNSLDDLII